MRSISRPFPGCWKAAHQIKPRDSSNYDSYTSAFGRRSSGREHWGWSRSLLFRIHARSSSFNNRSYSCLRPNGLSGNTKILIRKVHKENCKRLQKLLNHLKMVALWLTNYSTLSMRFANLVIGTGLEDSVGLSGKCDDVVGASIAWKRFFLKNDLL